MYIFLLILAFYLPFQLAINPSEGIDLASARVLILALFLIWLARGFARKKLWVAYNAQTMWLVSFVFMCVFSGLMAENKEWFSRKLLFLLSVIPIYFVVCDVINNKEKAIKLIKVVVSSGALVALVGIIQFVLQFVSGLERTYSLWAAIIKPFLGASFSEAVLRNPSWLVNISGNTYLRATSFFPDPHMFSFYLGMLIPLSGGLYFIKKQAWAGAAFFVLLAADVLTFSRGGYLGLAGGMTMALFMFRDRIRRSYFGLIAALFGVIILAALIPNPVFQRFNAIFDREEGSNKGRIEMWTKASGVLRENLILGVGLGNYPLAVKATASYREPIYAHNTYLDIAVETGMLSLASWAFFLLFIFVSFYNKSKQHPVFGAGAISIIIFSVHSLVETGIYSPVVLGILMILGGISGVNEKFKS